ncbi:MAG TPA: ATP-binding protein [Holophaga sp.]|nr:ATP-binding protein [Holophaga sp.]
MFPWFRAARFVAALWAACMPMAGDWTEAGRPAVKSYGQRDGLPHHTVHTLLRDRLGRLWACTQLGAARYDGRRWVPVLLPGHAESQFVRTLAEDPADGSLWFGTQGAGVWRLTDRGWEDLGAERGLPSQRVHHVLAGPGGMWAATDVGPARWVDGAWHPVVAGLPKAWTWKLARLDVPGLGPSLVACTQGGLFALSGEAWSVPPAFQALAGLEVNDALQGAGGLWASVWGRGPARWEGGAWAYPRPGDGFPGRFPTCLAASPDPRGGDLLWVGTYEQGLACLRGGRWQVLTTERGLRNNGVYTILPDPHGRPTVWIGMQGGGITALSLEGWVSFPGRQMGVAGSRVSCLLETDLAPFRGLVVGTRVGLAWREPDGWRLQDHRQGLPADDVRSLAVVDMGRPVLFAGTSAGLARWDGKGWKREPGLPAEEVNVLLASRKPGVLYAGFRSGLRILGPGGWSAPGLAGDRPEPLSLAETAEDGEGSLWVGTRGQGLWRVRAGQWRRLDPQPAYPRQWFTALRAFPGPKGEPWLWVGTRGNGLLYAPVGAGDPPWRVLGAPGTDELPHTVVLRIERDGEGRIYLGTTGGVERLRFSASGHLESLETYTTGDGLPATGVSLGASLTDRVGRVWFGFPDGAAFLDPREEARRRPLPAPVLARALVAGREGTFGPGAVLGHRENNLSLDFFLPVFFREEDVRFRTQLEGSEPFPGPWRYEGSRDYPGLRPGRYVLKVWARNHLGQEAGPLVLPFRIRPPWYWGPGAWTVYALAALGALLGSHRLRDRVHQRRERELRRRVEEATAALASLNRQLEHSNEEKSVIMGVVAHDLRNPLTAIRLQAELLEGGPAAREAGRIRRGADDLLGLVERLLAMNRLEAGEVLPPPVPLALPPLAEEALERVEVAARQKGLVLALEPAPDLPLALGDRLSILEILDNLLSNAVKFSPPGPPAREVRVTFLQEADAVGFRIADQGPGFSPDELKRAFGRYARLTARPTGGEGSSGLGLAIVKKLSEALGGRVDLDSRPGEGATFTVRLPRATP